jgi:tetratricopeptide (TPR) repeat protein
MITFSLLLLSGLLLDITSILLFSHFQGWMLMALFGAHLLASGCIMLAINQFKSYYRHYSYALIVMLFLLVFFVPVLGILGSLIIARALSLSQDNYRKHPIHHVVLDDADVPLRNKYGAGGLRVNLQSADMPLVNRINALKILSTMAPGKINNLIRTILPDKQEELRLLAFNLLKSQEKTIFPEISKALQLLKNEKSALKQAKLHKWIALEYWELVYRSLVEPNLVDFVLQQAYHYTQLALDYFEYDATLWLLLGRIFHRQNYVEQAVNAFERALACGAREDTIVPYLVEAYFYQRKFSAIKPLIAAQKKIYYAQISQAVIDFWSEPNDE